MIINTSQIFSVLCAPIVISLICVPAYLVYFIMAMPSKSERLKQKHDEALAVIHSGWKFKGDK